MEEALVENKQENIFFFPIVPENTGQNKKTQASWTSCDCGLTQSPQENKWASTLGCIPSNRNSEVELVNQIADSVAQRATLLRHCPRFSDYRLP